MLEGLELWFGDGDAVELFEQVGDAAALEHNAAAGDLRRVRGEDGRDADETKKRAGMVGADAGLAHASEGPAQVATLYCACRGNALAKLMGETTAFAVIGLGQVDELEVEAEGPGELVGGGKVEGADASERLLEMRGGGGRVGHSALWGFGLATGDGGAAQRFDGAVEGVAGLLAEDLAEEHSKRADIAAQGRFLEFAGGGLKLGEALGPVGWGPE